MGQVKNLSVRNRLVTVICHSNDIVYRKVK